MKYKITTVKKKYIILLSLIVMSLITQAQTTFQSHKFTVPKQTSLILQPANDIWSPSLKKRQLPIPKSGIDEVQKQLLKDSLSNQYPRKKNKSTDKSSIVAPPALLRNFIGNSFSGFVPNDNDMAISNNGTVCSVTNVNIWTKNLNTNIAYGSYSLHSLMIALGLQTEEFDPKIVYDPETNRFVLLCLNGFTDLTSNVVIGFSQTDSTNGAWNFYSLPGNPLNNTLWTDFPMLALTHDELFITVNLLYNDSSWQTGFNETVIWQMNKHDGYAGDSLNAQLINNISFNGGRLRNLCPVKGGSQLYGPSMRFLSNRNFAATNDTVFLVTVTDTAFSPTQTVTVNYAVGNTAYRMPVDAIQPFVDKLAVNDARVLGAFEENGKIQFVLNTFDTVTGNDAIYHGIMDSITSTPVLTSSIYADPVLDLAYPNIAFAGSTALSDSSIISLQHTSSSVFPGSGAVLYSANQFSPITIVKSGISYINMLAGNDRWGDYTGCQTKFNQPGTVWMSGGYALANHTTRTWIGELTSSTSAGLQDEVSTQNNSLVYPNPTKERITVSFMVEKTQKLNIGVYDMQGKMIKLLFDGSVVKGDNEFSFNNAELLNGAYIIKINGSTSGLIASKKFVKN